MLLLIIFSLAFSLLYVKSKIKFKLIFSNGLRRNVTFQRKRHLFTKLNLEILTSGVFLWSVSYIGYMSITIILIFLESSFSILLNSDDSGILTSE